MAKLYREIQYPKCQIEKICIQFHLLFSLDDPISTKYIEEIEKAKEERYLNSEEAHKTKKILHNYSMMVQCIK